jgi:hypothetical protein
MTSFTLEISTSKRLKEWTRTCGRIGSTVRIFSYTPVIRSYHFTILHRDFKFLSTFSPSQVGECRNMYLFSCVLIMYYMSAYPGPFIELPPLTSTLSCLDSWRLKGRMEYIWIITEVGLLSMPGLLTISEIEAIDRSELYVIFLSDPSFFMTKQWIGRQPSYLWNEGF